MVAIHLAPQCSRAASLQLESRRRISLCNDPQKLPSVAMISAPVFPNCQRVQDSDEFIFRASNVAVRSDGIRAQVEARLGGLERKGGAGLLERPGLDQSSSSSAPKTDEGGEMGKLRQRLRHDGGDRYRVLLLDHERHTESYVAKVLPTVVPSVTADDARRIFAESREMGAGLVTLAVKEHAEFYAQMMVRKGLRSTIAPDGPLL
eukprot:TRINITY_DN2829_c0_g1_i1.p1 TRINITY_DN2829_c0_g1~~TRINITY_DN2829_c0_g1_i1.p1  ORF type:complete len:205 (+),score=18.51 TRINITY_DN2829_c0_g1_i1:99-713(+)